MLHIQDHRQKAAVIPDTLLIALTPSLMLLLFNYFWYINLLIIKDLWICRLDYELVD